MHSHLWNKTICAVIFNFASSAVDDQLKMMFLLKLNSKACYSYFRGPVPVLVMSLIFIASVFMLHIWGKYNRSWESPTITSQGFFFFFEGVKWTRTEYIVAAFILMTVHFCFIYTWDWILPLPVCYMVDWIHLAVLYRWAIGWCTRWLII